MSVQERPHRLRALPHPGGQGHHGLRLRILQVRGRLLLLAAHRGPSHLLGEFLYWVGRPTIIMVGDTKSWEFHWESGEEICGC